MIEIGFATEYLVVFLALLLCSIMAIIRVIRGPTAPDRIVGLDTINTIVIVLMVVFGAATKQMFFILIHGDPI